MGHVALNRENKRRPAELIDQFRRDDSDDPAMPSLAPHDDHILRTDLGIGRDRPPRAAMNLRLFLTTPRILCIQLCRQLVRLLRLRLLHGQQQARCQVRCGHAAGSIDTGRQFEANLFTADPLPAKPTRVNQRTKPDGMPATGQLVEPKLCDHAILSAQRHNICHSAHRCQFEKPWQPALVASPGTQGLHHLERHSDAGEVLVGIRAISPAGGNDRQGRRQCGLRFVVISDDEIDPDTSSPLSSTLAPDSTINRHDHLYIHRLEPVDPLRLKTVPIRQTFRDVMDDVASQKLDRASEHHGRGHAIDVVVTVYRNLLSPLYRCRNGSWS